MCVCVYTMFAHARRCTAGVCITREFDTTKREKVFFGQCAYMHASASALLQEEQEEEECYRHPRFSLLFRLRCSRLSRINDLTASTYDSVVVVLVVVYLHVPSVLR